MATGKRQVKLKTGWTAYTGPLLKTIRVDSNAMSVADVTAFIKEFYLSTPFTYYGLIRMTQLPAAVIVDTSALSAITKLTNPIASGGYGWVVLRDV